MSRDVVHTRPLLSALWILAAKSELEDRNSSESARHLFLRALRFHPEDKKVYLEVKAAMCHLCRGGRCRWKSGDSCVFQIFISNCHPQPPCQYFRMELLHCEKLRKQKEELEKAEMDLVSGANSTNYSKVHSYVHIRAGCSA